MALNAQQLAEIRQILDSRGNALRAEISDDESKVRSQLGRNDDAGREGDDRFAAMQAVDIGDAELERDLHELEQIQAARLRLDAGSYGLCVDCGQPIPYDRLRAQPATARCLDCQRKHERSSAGG